MKKLSVLMIALVLALGAGSAFTARTAGAADQTNVAIKFGLSNNNSPVACGVPVHNLGSSRVEAKLRETRFYVYGVKLIDPKGVRQPLALEQNDWQYADLALIDFRDTRDEHSICGAIDRAKNAVITGAIPAGDYVGLEFSVGVPVESRIGEKLVALNHSAIETAAPPLDIQSMAWNWQAGRKFLLVEVDPPAPIAKSDGSKAKTWMVHLGSSGCKGNPATGEIASCAFPNRVSVKLDRFNAKAEQVNLDLATLFKESDLGVDKGGAIGCMTGPDDPECLAIYKAVGLNPLGSTDGGLQTKPGVSPIFSAGPIVSPSAGGKK